MSIDRFAADRTYAISHFPSQQRSQGPKQALDKAANFGPEMSSGWIDLPNEQRFDSAAFPSYRSHVRRSESFLL